MLPVGVVGRVKKATLSALFYFIAREKNLLLVNLGGNNFISYVSYLCTMDVLLNVLNYLYQVGNKP